MEGGFLYHLGVGKKAVILAIRLSFFQTFQRVARSSATNAGLLGIQKYSGRRGAKVE